MDLEAVSLRRELFDHNPDAYRADLAMSLYNLGADLQKLQRWEEARDTYIESVGLRRELFDSDPTLHMSALIDALFNLASSYRGLGDWSAAQGADTQAVSLYNITGQVIRDAGVSFESAGAYGTTYPAAWLNPQPLDFDPEPRTGGVSIQWCTFTFCPTDLCSIS